MYEFPTIPEYCVSPHRVLAERLLRTVRRQVIADPALTSSVLRTPEFSSRAFGSVALSKCPLSTSELRSSKLRPVEVRSVSASSVQFVLRQAFSRVAVPRSRPALVASSVASSVLTSPTFSTPKRILSSALHTSKRAAQAEKVLRISLRLAQLK